MIPLITLAIVMPMFTYLLSRVFKVIEIESRATAYTVTLKLTARRPVRSFER